MITRVYKSLRFIGNAIVKIAVIFCCIFTQFAYGELKSKTNVLDKVNIFFQQQNAQRIFNAKITPDEFFINEAVTAKVSVEILPGNSPLSSAIVYETDNKGNLLSELGKMDKKSCDNSKAGSCIPFLVINLNERQDTIKYIRIEVIYVGDVKPYRSPTMTIDFFENISFGVIEKSSITLKTIKALYLKRLSCMFQSQARALAYKEALNNPDIKSVFLHYGVLSILFKGGSRGFKGSVYLKDNFLESPHSIKEWILFLFSLPCKLWNYHPEK